MLRTRPACLAQTADSWTAVVGLMGLGIASLLGPVDAAMPAELKGIPYRIVYETWQGDNWELFLINADGSKPRNLTRTPRVDELYPHVSPDGTKICFEAGQRPPAEGRGLAERSAGPC